MNTQSIRPQIQQFDESKTQGVGELILSIQRGEFGVTITIDDQPDLLNIPSFYQSGNGNFWCAEHDGRIVGTLGLFDIGEGRVGLRKMFVHPDYRGKEAGTAQSLYDTAQAWCESRGVREIVLGTISVYHAAHRFYERNGFRRVEKEELPASFPRMAVDDRFFTKQLSGV